jgi:hypothetical protein
MSSQEANQENSLNEFGVLRKMTVQVIFKKKHNQSSSACKSHQQTIIIRANEANGSPVLGANQIKFVKGVVYNKGVI